MATPEEQLPQLTAAVTAAGDAVKQLKTDKADKAVIDEAVKKLKQAKSAMDQVLRKIEAKTTNPFEERRENLEDVCTRRFFFRPAFDIYGGVGGFWTYGPPGCAVKNNLIALWRKHFVIEEGLFEIEDTCIMPHRVLEASGHVARFNDFMVKDVKDHSKYYRADKLLEEAMDRIIKDGSKSQAEKDEAKKVSAQADGYTREELHEQLQRFGVKSPDTGNDLSEPYPFNLMFPTPIGPAGDSQGYLRPETAQGVFLNFKYCLEQNGGVMPFGMAQVGKAFRNEIAPRGGLIRQREFTQCEIEFFCKPVDGDKPHPKFVTVAGDAITLFPSHQQLNALPTVRTTVGEAVRSKTINNETLGFFIARTQSFLLRAGIKAEHLRFRQHLPTEMAHYACDCWDAEIEFSHGWVECVGVADRSAYDLTAHANASGTELKASETLDVPIKKEVVGLSKKAAGSIGKDFKADAKTLTDHFATLSNDDKLALKAEAANGGKASITVNGKPFDLLPAHVDFEKREETINTITYVPNVVEPSFGIDRILYAIFEHSYYERPSEEKEDEKKEAKAQKDKMERGVFGFHPAIAPLKVQLVPLDARITRDEKYQEMSKSLRVELSNLGVSSKTDESGVAIGKKYARGDELGVPFAITFDGDSLAEGKPSYNTATLRERDSCEQVRIALADAPAVLLSLCEQRTKWADIKARFEEVKQSASAKVGHA